MWFLESRVRRQLQNRGQQGNDRQCLQQAVGIGKRKGVPARFCANG